MEKQTTKNLILTALFVALIAVGAFIRIPLPAVPFTLQYPMTMLAGLLLGGKRGCLAVCAYIVLGLMGLPIFASGSSGVGYALQPSFGYILGFALGALLTGSIARGTPSPSWKRLLAANLAGMAVVYCLGTVYYYLITTVYLQESIGLWPLIVSCCLITAPKDIALCVLAAVLGKRLIPLVQTGKVA